MRWLHQGRDAIDGIGGRRKGEEERVEILEAQNLLGWNRSATVLKCNKKVRKITEIHHLDNIQFSLSGYHSKVDRFFYYYISKRI